MIYAGRLTAALVPLFLALLVNSGPGTASGGAEKHRELVGKPAPDVKADFAFPGKPFSLADLRGKVVVLVLWAPSSPNSRNALSDLLQWHGQYHLKGLEIVGANRYSFDLNKGQGFALDDKGRLEAIANPTPATEQQLLKDIARAFKLTFPLFLLGGDDGAKAFQAYGVTAIPQFVVIDRKGVVQSIKVGTRRETLNDLEIEIKGALER